MSVVVATSDRAALEKLLVALRAQTARERLELVIAAPGRAGIGDAETAGFASAQLVEAEPARSLPAARAAGVRAARAPIVVFAETHSYPDPRWAEALIDRAAGPWAAVGPAIVSATPDDQCSWGALLVDYGPWVAPVAGGPVADLPGHGSAYRRSLLLGYGDDLERMLEAEWVLHRDLRARGHRLYLEPAATTRHLNINRPLPAALQWLHYSRGLASARCRDWSLPRRVLYAAATPGIFAVRLARTLRHMQRTGRMRALPPAFTTIAASLGGSALGELAGYVSGSTGSSAERIVKYEVHRERYVDATGDIHPAHPAEPRRIET